MIKKYQSFFGSITIKLSIEKAFKNFCETLGKCQSYLSENSDSRAYNSYSYVAQENKGDIDPEIDFREIDKYMSENGWDLKTVKELTDGITNFADRMEREQISRTAAVDYYLYKITKNEFPLQGYEWHIESMDDPEQENNEFLIKFSYGWHKTRYGRLVILQNMGSIEKFFSTAFKNVPDYVFMFITSNYHLSFSDTQREKIMKNFFLDEEISEIYIDSDNLLIELKELEPTRISLNSNERDGTPIEKEKLLIISQGEFDKFIVNILLKNDLKSRIITPGDIKVSL